LWISFYDTTSICSPDWTQTHIPPASVFWEVRLQVCTPTTPGSILSFYLFIVLKYAFAYFAPKLCLFIHSSSCRTHLIRPPFSETFSDCPLTSYSQKLAQGPGYAKYWGIAFLKNSLWKVNQLKGLQPFWSHRFPHPYSYSPAMSRKECCWTHCYYWKLINTLELLSFLTLPKKNEHLKNNFCLHSCNAYCSKY
jgi:hypothetical protein